MNDKSQSTQKTTATLPPPKYYACLEIAHLNAVVKIPFYSRQEAREYISQHYDKDFHTSCWTE